MQNIKEVTSLLPPRLKSWVSEAKRFYEIGKETEYNANLLLKKIYDEVKWISKENQYHPYDFLCKKIGTNEEIKIDVKSCLGGVITISKKKWEMIENGKFGEEFYFMLRINTLTFNMIHYKELKKKYKVILTNSSKKYVISKTSKMIQKEILNYLKNLKKLKTKIWKINYNGVSMLELSRKINISYPTIQKYVLILELKNKIKVIDFGNKKMVEKI